MAELLRGGGGLEPARGPQYRTALLPWEQQICETLGIDESDYFNYFDLISQYKKEEQHRELIPDVRNEAVTIVTLVVGLALSAVGMLLTPKPRAPSQQKQGNPFEAQNIRGRTKFSPLAEFDSVQDLAALGTLVPLIYCRQEGDHGGVRVESQLLWSRMTNKPTYQELSALLLFGAAKMDRDPDFEGFAFGDSRMTGYANAKIGLFFSRGESAEEGNQPFFVSDRRQYSEGTKDIGPNGSKPFYTSFPDDGRPPRMVFCGVVTPNQSSAFGQYSPLRNGHAWKYPFKYPGKGDGDGDRKEIIYGTRRKHVAGYHAGRTTLKRRSGNDMNRLVYRIQDSDSDKIFQATGSTSSNPDLSVREHFKKGDLRKLSVVREDDGIIDDIGGLTEGLEAINQSRIDADSTLDVGELYLIGSKIYRCTERKNEKGLQGTPYEPKESGSIQFFLDEETDYSKEWVDDDDILTDDSEDCKDETHCPVQKVAVGSIATTRTVDMVELGIKSIVYRNVSGQPNVTQFTYKEIANDFAKEGQGFQLGTINSYYERVALFRLEVKRGNGNWTDLFGEELFAVHGANPQPSYNTIQIKVPERDFYEFRFIPVSSPCSSTLLWDF